MGCFSDVDDRRDVAQAKCSVPVDKEVGLYSEQASSSRKDGVEVVALGDGRYRVTGTVTGDADGMDESADFICEVAPDDSDKLRGFRVTNLEVTPHR